MSLRKAIDEKCKDCIYDPLCGGGTWREQVAQCSAVSCPLWPVRPFPSAGPHADSPRTALEATPEWRSRPIGWVVSSVPTVESVKAIGEL